MIRIFAFAWSLLVLLLHVALMRRDPMWGLRAPRRGTLMLAHRWRSPRAASGSPATRNVL